MAENGSNGAGAGATVPVQPSVQVMGQFLRDFSFENIMVQKGISGEVNPEISVQVGLDAKKGKADNQYEVMSKYSVKSRNKTTDETLFLVELEYGGIFKVENVAEEQLHPFLMIECPRLLFPYVRRLVADVTREGGFPALNMESVDFVALYRQLIQQKMAEQQQTQA